MTPPADPRPVSPEAARCECGCDADMHLRRAIPDAAGPHACITDGCACAEYRPIAEAAPPRATTPHDPTIAEPLPRIPASDYLARFIGELLTLDLDTAVGRVVAANKAHQAARIIATFCARAPLAGTPPTTPPARESFMSKEWCLAMAEQEGRQEAAALREHVAAQSEALVRAKSAPLERDAARMREAAKRVTQNCMHAKTCSVYSGLVKCSCGMDALVAALAPSGDPT